MASETKFQQQVAITIDGLRYSFNGDYEFGSDGFKTTITLEMADSDTKSTS